MFEFRIVIRMERGEEQVFIVNTDAANEAAAKDQIQYLVNNSLEIVSMEQIKLG
jgi:type III secretory pathway lipoprotein EscJ